MSDMLEFFEMEDRIGEGSFGTVWRATDKHTLETVAIKSLKEGCHSWEDCLDLTEVKCQQHLRHPNIVHLKNVFMEKKNVYLVFENMDYSLLKLMRLMKNRRFSETTVRHYMFQLLLGLAHMHQQGYMHRDLKPDNVLVSKGVVVKIADLGMARKVSAQPCREMVTTLWYRAPEVLFCMPHGPAIDMWAIGCIMAELLMFRPLFMGSSHADQIYKICGVIGSPDQEKWAEGVRRASELCFKFPEFGGGGISKMMAGASSEAIDLINSLCAWDPSKRPTAKEALQHSFFASCYRISRSLGCIPPGFEKKSDEFSS